MTVPLSTVNFNTNPNQWYSQRTYLYSHAKIYTTNGDHLYFDGSKKALMDIDAVDILAVWKQIQHNSVDKTFTLCVPRPIITQYVNSARWRGFILQLNSSQCGRSDIVPQSDSIIPLLCYFSQKYTGYDLLLEVSGVFAIDHSSNDKWSRCMLVMMRRTLYVDEAYWKSKWASSYITMTCLKISFIVNVPVYHFTYIMITWLLHSATYTWHNGIQ